jgi:hypothetical protein
MWLRKRQWRSAANAVTWKYAKSLAVDLARHRRPADGAVAHRRPADGAVARRRRVDMDINEWKTRLGFELKNIYWKLVLFWWIWKGLAQKSKIGYSPLNRNDPISEILSANTLKTENETHPPIHFRESISKQLGSR